MRNDQGISSNCSSHVNIIMMVVGWGTECLLGLLKSKTVIYITHQVEFLPNADLILVSDSRISWSRIQTTAFRQFTILLVSDFELEKNVENTNDQTDKSNDTVVEPKGQLVQEEEREKGRVGFKVYWKYIITAYVEEQESKTLLGNGYSSYMVTIVVAGVFTYLVKGQDHGIQIVPLSFDLAIEILVELVTKHEVWLPNLIKHLSF
ncbi:hypothetical protein JHK87_055302 [Glycine soja]|nr:hypothetical protein JHK87_055302 [Glycine soja]